MGVVLNVGRQSVVDDVGQVVHVESACSHVGGHEQLCEVLAELLHGQVALLLREVSVQCLGVVSVLDEHVGHLLRLQFGPAEDDGEDFGVVVHNALQGEVLVLCLHHIVDMVHVFCPLVAAAYDYLFVVVQILFCYSFYLAAHRGREHQRGVLFGQCVENLVDAVCKAHIQHFVGLVEYYVGHVLQMRYAAIFQVDESARRGHNDLHALFERAYLRFDGRPAIDGLHVYAVQVFGKVAQVAGYLQAQLPGRTEYQCLCVAVGGVDALQQGYAKGSRLARTRLCKCNHVLSAFNQEGYDGFLYWHRRHKSQFFYGAADGAAHA